MKFDFYVNGLTYSPLAGIMSSTLIPMVQQPGEERVIAVALKTFSAKVTLSHLFWFIIIVFEDAILGNTPNLPHISIF